MPPRPSHTVNEINPTCAALHATLTERLEQALKTQEHIVEVMWGNGKPGMTDILARAVEDLAAVKLWQQQQDARKEQRKEEARKQVWQFWAGVIMLILTTGMSVMQAFLLSRLVP